MRLISISLLVIVIAIATPARADCQMNPAATLPLLPSERLVVQASIDGTTVQMGIDTGAGISAVTPETVATFKFKPDPHGRQTLVAELGGQAVQENVILDKLGIADLIYSDMSVTVLPPQRPQSAVPLLAGLIGADLLSGFDLELNIPKRTLTLYRVVGCNSVRPPWEGAYDTVAASVARYNHFLFPVELNGHSIMADFDTGLRGEVVALGSAERLGVTEAELDKDPSRTGTSADPQAAVIRRHRFDTVKIGSETFQNVPMDIAHFHEPGIDMLVGLDYMRGRRFFVSYSTGNLFIQKVQGGSNPQGVPPPR